MSQPPPDSPAVLPPIESADAGVPPVLRPHRGVMILTFSIIGLATPVLGCACCIAFIPVGMVFSILAWIMGNSDLRAMQAGAMDPAGRGLTKAGKIVGMIGVIVQLVFIVLWIILAIASIVLGTAQGM
ncbi:MAG: hypothetical protein KAS72_00485 [Phycisphaerales bacterium]|nr:hypothetical protein [Phycisphaerales bacterium]